jgi:PAS domain S-box-containing protein
MQIEQGKTDQKTLTERLRFEEMLSDISARFISTSFDQVDSDIDNALRQLMEFFQVDLCVLMEVQEDRAFVRISHAVYGEGIEPIPGNINIAELYPWTYRKLMIGNPIIISRVEDYPEEARIDRQSYAAMGTASRLAIPVAVDGKISRIITIHQRQRRQVWPEEYLPRLRLLGEIIVNALERKRSSLQLVEQLSFETVLSEISGRFVNLTADQVDGEIVNAQRRVCECLGLDLSVLWQWTMETPRILTLTHLSRSLEEQPPEPMYASEYFPWCQQQLESGKTVIVSSMDDLPPEAARDKEVWQHFGIKTSLTFPLSDGGNPPIGALSFNTMLAERTWADALVKRLQIVAQIFTNALARKRADQTLRESEARLRLTTEAVGAGLWIMEVETSKVWVSPKSRELFHFSPDEEINYESYFMKIHPEDRDRIHQEVQHSLQSGESLLCDYRIVLPDGSIRWIVARGHNLFKSTGEPERMIGMAFDITERKEMELQLKESQTLISTLINSTPDLIWSVDAERFGLLTFNRGLAEYFLNGIGLHIEIGMNPDDLLPTKEFAQKWFAFYRRALEEGSFTTDYQAYAQGRILRLNFNLLKSDDVVFGVSVFAQDITELKAMESQLRQQLAEINTLKIQLEKENVYLREEINTKLGFGKIIGGSNALKYVLFRAEQVAPTDATVLILGETGTGKGMVAHAIHEMSTRKEKSMITINCAALPDNLIESELFGREKGAFTGAHARQIGRFEVADGGSIFLDEIGEMPLALQAKLLGVLQDGQFERLGSTRTIKVNVRVIAATSRDLKLDVRNGRFREDLYYRLNVFPVSIPPLRMRLEDIPELVYYFIDKYARKSNKQIETVSKGTMQILQTYPWPGNVRELEHIIERAIITSTGSTLQLADKLDHETEDKPEEALRDLEAIEREHILKVLQKTRWKVNGEGSAAAILGLKPSTLRFRIKKLGITRS